ncbi:MAG: hypothetical protein OXI37_04485 [Gammaproteobacteria bacterium]|nr:hypothetical protein [Gammaproteobacteria bacterium]
MGRTLPSMVHALTDILARTGFQGNRKPARAVQGFPCLQRPRHRCSREIEAVRARPDGSFTVAAARWPGSRPGRDSEITLTNQWLIVPSLRSFPELHDPFHGTRQGDLGYH